MPELDENELRQRIKVQEDKEMLAKVKGENLPFHLYIQKDPKRESEIEMMQKETFYNLIKNRDELKHLQGQAKELFIEFWLDFLKGECQSINDFLYINGGCEILDKKERAKDFLIKNQERFKYKLRERFQEK